MYSSEIQKRQKLFVILNYIKMYIETKVRLKQGGTLDLMNGIIVWDRTTLETLKNAMERPSFVDNLTDEEVTLINETLIP
jgi:hypothetical protein